MSDTNRVAIRATKEVSFGVVPATPDLQELCITGAPDLAFAPETTVSEKIRADRQIDDLPLVGAEAGGSINSELAFGVHDILLEGAFFNTFQSRVQRLNNESATQITNVDGTNDEFDVTDEGDAPVVNDIVRAQNFTNAANNGFHIVNGVPSNTLIPVASDIVDETPPIYAQLNVVGRRGDTGDLVLTITGSTGTLASTTTDLSTLDLAAGDWIKLAGFVADPDNNDWYRVSLTPTATLITFDIVPAGASSETPAGNVDIYHGERLINGTTRFSYTLEEEFGDHSPVTYQYFRGMIVDGLSLTAEPQSIVTINFTFSGKDAFFSDATTPASVPDQLPAVDGAGRVNGATTVTFGSANVLNSSSNVGRIARGGAPITGANFVLEASVEIANNTRQLPAVGFLGAVDIGVGEFGVTGTLSTYFDNADLARDVISNAETSFDIRFEDDDSHVVLIDAPRIKFSEGAPEVPGKNQDVTLPLSYQAIRQPVFGYTLAYFRFHGIQ